MTQKFSVLCLFQMNASVQGICCTGTVLQSWRQSRLNCYLLYFAKAQDRAGSCECGNEPSGSTKRGEFLDQLTTC
jgi:hypothetical protein